MSTHPAPPHHTGSGFNCCRPSHLRLRSRILRTSVIVTCMASYPGAAEAAGKAAKAPKKAPPCVQEILHHLQHHPMTLTSQPMQYDAEPTVPLPSCIDGLQAADVLPAGSHSSSSNAARDHMGRVIAGLLYAACGGLDAAHNLVTPLCWGSWTPYAGQPISGSPAAADAALCHAIIHRQEGSCIGEFGSGFSNATYWYRAAGQHPVLPQLLQAAQGLAKGQPKCEAHVAKHGSCWQPARFVELCSDVAASKDQDLLKFCDGVMEAEMHLLLEHCYSKL